MLVPALSRAKCRAQSIACMSSGKHIGLAWMLYADDNESKGANAFDWTPGWLDYGGRMDNTNVADLIGGRPNPGKPNETKPALLRPYLKNPAVYQCPADLSLSRGKQGEPRIRSISMNQMFRTWPDGHSAAPPLGSWRIYGKTSDMTALLPANLQVIIDENPDSVNDAAFTMKLDFHGPRALWQDGPATYHCGGCGFGFADGHSQSSKRKDARTTRPPMLATYIREFPFGHLHGNSPDLAWVQERTSAKAPGNVVRAVWPGVVLRLSRLSTSSSSGTPKPDHGVRCSKRLPIPPQIKKAVRSQGCGLPARVNRFGQGTGITRRKAYCLALEISNVAETSPLTPAISSATVCQFEKSAWPRRFCVPRIL